MRPGKKTYSGQDLINNHRIYSSFMLMGLDDGWGLRDKEDNFIIFTQIEKLTHTPIKDSTILDVGCGTGDFYPFLYTEHVKEYTGVDIFEPAVEKAIQKFPTGRFVKGDFLTMRFTKTFDFVFCSGALTTKLETDNYEIMKHWIPKMWSLAKRGVVFNFLMDDKSTSNFLFLYDPHRVIALCKTYVPDAKIETVVTDSGSGDGSEEMHVFLY